ncbi:hypothetical protein OUZ56_026323 [Daphnia magna]|uniref:Uncharacterized protein n=1 Tax=Daphnia magna TaxID=35525 RepID=A0ABQ9ZLG2_9CRUS|nr:hypothetical protein OUZ56_026323 [Daphnia magna]
MKGFYCCSLISVIAQRPRVANSGQYTAADDICVVAQRYGVGLITLTTLGTFPETASTRQFNLLSISRVANSGQQTAADDIK